MKVPGTDLFINPPPELLVAFDCLKFHTLPRSGGLQDQPMLLMRRMKIALNAYETVQAWREAQRAPADAFSKWSGMNPKIVKFMEYIWKLQGSFDG